MFENIIAKKLGLKDLGSEVPGFAGCSQCPDCKGKLRLGEDKHEYRWSYCPKCWEKIETISIPRFRPGIKVEKHDD